MVTPVSKKDISVDLNNCRFKSSATGLKEYAELHGNCGCAKKDVNINNCSFTSNLNNVQEYSAIHTTTGIWNEANNQYICNFENMDISTSHIFKVTSESVLNINSPKIIINTKPSCIGTINKIYTYNGATVNVKGFEY